MYHILNCLCFLGSCSLQLNSSPKNSSSLQHRHCRKSTKLLLKFLVDIFEKMDVLNAHIFRRALFWHVKLNYVIITGACFPDYFCPENEMFELFYVRSGKTCIGITAILPTGPCAKIGTRYWYVLLIIVFYRGRCAHIENHTMIRRPREIYIFHAASRRQKGGFTIPRHYRYNMCWTLRLVLEREA